MTGLPKDYAARKALPLFDFLTKYFPLALVEVTKIAVAGNEQHNPGEPLHWARGKSMDQLNTAMRHMFDHGMGNVYDAEPPEVEAKIGRTMHLAKAAWRILAEIQLICEQDAAAEAANPLIKLSVKGEICELAGVSVVLDVDEAWRQVVAFCELRSVTYDDGYGALDEILGLEKETTVDATRRAFREAWGG